MRSFLLAGLLFISFSSLARACKCLPSGGCPSLGSPGFPTFLGTVLEVTDLPRTQEFKFLSSRKARLRIDETFGGLAPNPREVEVWTGYGGGDCGIDFRPGETYLVNAGIGNDGFLHAGICSSTRRIDGPSALLRVLRLRLAKQQVPSLIGVIARIERNFKGSLESHPPKVLAKTMVRLKAEGKIYETQSDSDGIYQFFNLPNGKYEIQPDLPTGSRLSWYIGSDEPLPAIDLAGHCVEQTIEVFPSGSVEGRILDDSGDPVETAAAYIVPADEPQISGRLYSAFPKKGSRFRFVHIPAGRYHVLVNPDDDRRPNFPYGRTFYPGVRERASAGTITVREGEQVTGVDLWLGAEFKTRDLRVRVTWSDGRPVKTYVSMEAESTDDPRALANVKDNRDGTRILSVLDGHSYTVKAKMTCRYYDGQGSGPGAYISSNSVRVDAKDGQTELVLALSAAECPVVPGKRREN